MRIGIAGTGGIGSITAVHLVRSGVKELKNQISTDSFISKIR